MGLQRNFKTQVFDLTNLETAKDTLGEITDAIKGIRIDKELSDSDKQIKFNDFLDKLPDSNQFKEAAKGFDILKCSTDAFAKESLVDLYEGEIKSANGFVGIKSAIKTYNTACGESAEKGQLVAQAIQRQNSALGDYLIKQKGATTSAFDYGIQLVGMKAKALAARVGVMALNTAISMGVSLIVSAALSAFSEWYVSAEEAAQAATDLRDNFEQATSTIKSNIKTVQGFSDEFNKLSKGVDEHGKNISLTSDEYNRYKEIVEQLVEINPSLVQGYDSEHDAIVNKNDAIRETIELLKEENREKQKEFVTDDALETQVKGYEEEFENIKDKFEDEFDLNIPNTTWSWSGNLKDAQGRLLHELSDIIGWSTEVDTSGMSKYWTMNSVEFLDNISEFKEQYQSIIDEMLSTGEIGESRAHLAIDILEGMFSNITEKYMPVRKELDNLSKEINSTLQYVATSMKEYDNLSDAQKQFVTAYTNTFSVDFAKNVDTYVEAIDDKVDQVLNQKEKIQELVKEMPNDTDLSLGLEQAFSVDENTVASDYEKTLQGALELLKNSETVKNLNLSGEDLMSIIGLGNFNEIKDNLANRLKEVFDLSDSDIDKKLGNIPYSQLNDLYDRMSGADLSQFSSVDKALSHFFSQINDTKSIENLKNSYEEFTSKTFVNAEKDVNSFNSALQKLNSGGALTGDEMLNLIDLNSDLAGSFTKTKDGYIIDSNALLSAKKAYLQQTLDYIKAEIKANEELSKNLHGTESEDKERINNLTKQRQQAINKLTYLGSHGRDTSEVVKEIQKYDEQIATANTDLETTQEEIKNCDTRTEGLNARWEVLNNLVNGVGDGLDPVNDYLKLQEDKIDKIIEGINEEKKEHENIIKDIERQTKVLEKKKKVIEDEKKDLEKERDAIQDQIDLLERQLELDKRPHEDRIKQLEKEKQKYEDINKELEKQQKNLEDIADRYKTAGDTAIKYIDDQLEDSKGKIEEYYDTEIDKLKEKNEEIDRSISLKEKEDALYNAKRQKHRVWNESGGYEIKADSAAVNKAKNELDSLRRNYKIEDLESDKSKALEGELPTGASPELAKRVEQVKNLQDMKKRFEDATNSFTNAQNEATTQMLLGTSWKDRVLNGDVGVVESYEQRYNNVQDELHNHVEKNIDDNQIIIDSYNDKIDAENRAIQSLQDVHDAQIRDLNDEKYYIEQKIKNKDDIIGYYEDMISSQGDLVSNQQAIIDNLDDEATKWGDYKTSLEGVVKDITEGSHAKYMQSLDTLKIHQGNTLQDMEDNLKEFKTRIARLNALDNPTQEQINSILSGGYDITARAPQNNNTDSTTKSNNSSTNNKSKKTRYMLYYTKPDGTEEVLWTNDNSVSVSNYKKNLLNDLEKSPTDSRWKQFGGNFTKSTPKSAIKLQLEAVKKRLKIKEFLHGGAVDYTGDAKVHGTPQHSEVFFSSADAKRLYEMFHGNNNLGSEIVQNVGNNISKMMNDNISRMVNDVAEARKDVPNQSTTVYQAHFHNPVIQANNQQEFDRCMDNYFRKANQSTLVGKNR